VKKIDLRKEYVMANTAKYEKPFLSEVVLRIDFVSPYKELSVEIPNNLLRTILGKFPISEGTDQERITLGEPGWIQRLEWTFHDKQKNKRIVLSALTLLFDYKKYESFEALKSEFIPVMTSLFEANPALFARRFGLRYINRIRIDTGHATAWNDFLNDDLLSIFKVKEEYSDSLARAFHNLVWNFGDMTLNFNYGIHNSDFPAPIREKLFILDYDAFAEGAQGKDEIIRLLDQFHDKIQDLFEYSIKDSLRERMGKQSA
jgi:uncharacterized protein (TIGR04255 family)